MIIEIGITSGEILDLLEERRAPVSISEINLHLGHPSDLTHMAIGWLIRESHVRVLQRAACERGRSKSA